MLKVCPAVNVDLCSRKQSSGSDERVGKTDMCAVKATNPSARRIMYARRSIARCLLSYSKGFGLPAKQHLALAGGRGLTPKSSSPDLMKR